MYSYMKVSPRRERSCILTWRFHHTVKGYVFLHEDFTIPWKVMYSYMKISPFREKLCILTWRFHYTVKGCVFLHGGFTTPWKAMYFYMKLSPLRERLCILTWSFHGVTKGCFEAGAGIRSARIASITTKARIFKGVPPCTVTYPLMGAGRKPPSHRQDAVRGSRAITFNKRWWLLKVHDQSQPAATGRVAHRPDS